MGHLIFIILHVIAVLFGFVFLVITIPLHLIYFSSEKRNKILLDKENDLVRSKELDLPVEEITKGRESAQKIGNLIFVVAAIFIIFLLSNLDSCTDKESGSTSSFGRVEQKVAIVNNAKLEIEEISQKPLANGKTEITIRVQNISKEPINSIPITGVVENFDGQNVYEKIIKINFEEKRWSIIRNVVLNIGMEDVYRVTWKVGEPLKEKPTVEKEIIKTDERFAIKSETKKYVTTDYDCRLLRSPDSENALIRIPKNTKLEALEERRFQQGRMSNLWYKVSYSGYTGWTSGFNMKSQPEVIITTVEEMHNNYTQKLGAPPQNNEMTGKIPEIVDWFKNNRDYSGVNFIQWYEPFVIEPHWIARVDLTINEIASTYLFRFQNGKIVGVDEK